MKDTIIYIRTSTDDQQPENQIKACENLCNGEYELFQDKQSAFTDKKDRDGFEEAKKLIKSKTIKHFITWDLDRIYRNRKRLREFFAYCKVYNCNIHSVNQEWLEKLNTIQPPFNEIVHDLMLNLMGWLAEDESKRKSDRVKLAIRKEKGQITKSYKGKKWGRKNIPGRVKKEIMELRGKKLSMRQIADSVFNWDKNGNRKKISLGFVHKTIKEFEA